ncbi:unnamed protein product [Rotaria sp. Silwood2]|nr:unnamed protein product [Rotaria sp. Silwood2]
MIYSVDKRVKSLLVFIGVVIIFILVTLALAAATLSVVVNLLKNTTTHNLFLGSQYAESIKISDVMMHLNELQNIATNANGTRAINTLGFNRTLDYINNYLSSHTNFKVTTDHLYLRNFVIGSNPILITFINGVTVNRIFSTNLSASEFSFLQYTRSANFPTCIPINVIPNLGCSDNDWLAAKLSPNDRVALVKRGDSNFAAKAAFASKYNVTALLLYKDGMNNELPGLFLSYALGQELADAAQNSSNNVSVRITISVADESKYPVGNMCADTPTGDVTQTIVVGTHSDGARAGPGINDNGSGSAASLGLAVALARLFQMSTYEKYRYRVRFCWWGAEEEGLLGSNYHVKQAKLSTVVGERLDDYLIIFNYDMLASPNYMFGVYDGRTVTMNTPSKAIPGTNKMTTVFREWFIRQNLPWTYTEFAGGSDYAPFLAEGIAAGALFSGADEIKSIEERNYYDKMLGQGMGGIAGAIHDPCYHQACDSIQNVNIFAYEKMIQAAVYALEYVARQDDLKGWLYPPDEIQRLNIRQKQRPEYKSINEYFGLPYF